MTKHKRFTILIFLSLFVVLAISHSSQAITPINNCTTLSSSGEYILTQDINSSLTCMVISSSNVNLDCQGNTLKYGGGGLATRMGIDVTSGTYLLSNITISNCIIQDINSSGATGFGLRMSRVSNSHIYNNQIYTNGTNDNYGIYLTTSCNNNLIENNSISAYGSTSTNIGAYLLSSSNNTLRNNIIFTQGTTNAYGILLSTSADNNILEDNQVYPTTTSTGGHGVYITISGNNTLLRNEIHSRASSTAYALNLVTTHYNLIKDNILFTNGTITGTMYGIYLSDSIFNNFLNNNIRTYGVSSNDGVYVTTSNLNNFFNNTIYTDGAGGANYGIFSSQSKNNTYISNTLFTNGLTTTNYGITLQTSSNDNLIYGNMITTYGTTSNYGIHVLTSFNNLLERNIVSTNGSTRTGTTSNYGLFLTTTSQYNKIFNNQFSTDGGNGNYCGYLLTDSDENFIFNNSFIGRGNGSTNIGFYVSASNKNIVDSNYISSMGAATNYGLYVYSTSLYNTFSNNNIINTLPSSTSPSIIFVSTGTSYPKNNILQNNNILTPYGGIDLTFTTLGINDNYLINQPIRNYSFVGLSLLNFKTDYGQIRYTQPTSGVGGNLTDRINIEPNSIQISPVGNTFNRSAELTIYNLSKTVYDLNIYRNGVLCINCINLTPMNAGDVTFNITPSPTNVNYSILRTDRSPQIIDVISPINNTDIITPQYPISFKVTDENSTTFSCNLKVDDIIQSINDSVSNGTQTSMMANLSGGSHYWNIECFDQANGSVVSETRIINNPPPTLSLSITNNATYLNNQYSTILGVTGFDTPLTNLTIVFYGDGLLLSTQYSSPSSLVQFNWTNLGLGLHNWSASVSDGVSTTYSENRVFNIINLSINCDVGGPYQEGASIFLKSNISDGLTAQPNLNTSLRIRDSLNNTVFLQTSSTDLNGRLNNEVYNLPVGNYYVNYSTSLQGFNKQCLTSFSVGGPAYLIASKTTIFSSINQSHINYNLTIDIINAGMGNATNINIIDEYNFTQSVLSPKDSISFSYIVSLQRESPSEFIIMPSGIVIGTDSFTHNLINDTIDSLILYVPSKDISPNIILSKNIYLTSQNSTTITYNTSLSVSNSGGTDLSNITLIDSDMDINLLINLNISQSYSTSTLLTLNKAASNLEQNFVKATATVNSVTYESNQLKILLPGYGGPADTYVYAPSEVLAKSTFSTRVNILNMNPDIGQNFFITYWITNNDETVNYSSSQSTTYVGALGAINVSVSLMAPELPGTYKFRALVDYIGGPDIAYDSFEVKGLGSFPPGVSYILEQERKYNVTANITSSTSPEIPITFTPEQSMFLVISIFIGLLWFLVKG